MNIDSASIPLTCGTIDIANARRGRYSAQMDDGEFIAFELLDSIELHPGDHITARLSGHGGQDFLLRRDGQKFAVFVEMIGASRKTASAWALA